ncbi:MAG: hypothetical protein QHC90_23380 [Shinella sp.]|nr:hypothetical protein [Shinella sp.]
MIHIRHLRTMLAGAALTAFAGPAFALDGADLVNKLNAISPTSGFTVGYDTIAVEGSTITLRAAELRSADGKSVKVGDVTLEGVEEDGNGGYTVESALFPDINNTQDEVTITAQDMKLTGLAIPGKPETGTLQSVLMYEEASSGPVSVSAKGRQVFSMSGMQANITRQANDAGVDFDATLSDIKADLSGVEDAKTKDAIEKLGLQSLDGEVTMKGSWELASGTLAVDEYAFDFTDVGRLDLSLNLSGYTLQFLTALQDTMKAMESNPNKEDAQAAFGMSMMGLMQQLTFNNASISFADASLTKKLLDYAGSQQGVSGEQMAQSLKGLVPIMIAQLNLPELQNQISEAVNTYLDDPKTLTITAKPEKPVPFPMIMGAAMGAPNTIPQVLGVKVTAND